MGRVLTALGVVVAALLGTAGTAVPAEPAAAVPSKPATTSAASLQPAPRPLPAPLVEPRLRSGAIVDKPDRFVPPAGSDLAAPAVAAPSGSWLTTGPHPIGYVGCEDNFCPPPFELGFGNFGGTNTGRIDSLVVIPSGSHAGRVVAGSAGGGVWVSDNGVLAGWDPASDNAPSLAIGAMAVDPTNPDHLLAGTGEANQSGDSYPGFGMLVSGDGGVTWTAQNPKYASTTSTTYTFTSATDTSAHWTVNQWAGAVVRAGQVFATVATNTATSLTFTGSWSAAVPVAGTVFTVSSFDGEGIAQVAFDPGNALHMYAATSQGLFLTTDGGNTWAKPTSASYATVEGNITGVVVVPGSPGPTVYIGGGAKQLARSTDGGTTWAVANTGMSLAASGQPYTALALAAGTPATLYASVGTTTGSVVLYRASDVPSITWTSVGVPDYTGNAYAYGGSCTPGPTTSCEQGNYDNVVAIDPTNANHILAAGETVVESTNGGTTWQNVNGTAFNNSSTNPLHPDQHALAFAPDGSVWIGNDGGVYRYSGGQVQNKNVISAALADTQFYFGFTEVPSRGVLGGTQDNSTTEGYPQAGWFGLPGKEIQQGYFGWQGISSGDGGPTALWQFTKNGSSSTYGLFEADQRLFINGPNFASSGSAVDITPTAVTASTPFTPPMITVPNSADAANPTVFYGGVDLWRTTNPIASPPTWTQVTSVGKNVSAIAVAPSDRNTVYVGFQDGTVQVSVDGGQTFTSLAAQPFTETWVTGISVNPQNSKQITVSVSYNDTRNVNGPAGGANPHVGQYLWSTSAGTGTWTVITGSLPPESGVSRVIYDNGALVAATDVGVYAATAPNGDSTVWSVVGKRLPRVQVQDLYLDSGTGVLFAVTHGRGAWELHKPIFGAAVAGDNSSGELGGGSTAGFSPAPYIACCPSNVKSAEAGEGSHMVALLTNGTVMAWGSDYAGQLGDGITTSSSHVPVKVKLPAGSTVKAVAAGGDQSLALLGGGSILAWGGDANGELGDGGSTNSNVPVQVKLPAGDTATAIAAGYNFSLALLANGTVLAWGSNDSGQLGNSRAQYAASSVPIPVQLPAGVTVTAIAAGDKHALARLSDGSLLAWGNNGWGQLGNGTTNEADTPVQVSLPAGASVAAIGAGFNHSLAALAAGGVLAWGDNTFGELGNGTNSGPNCGGTCSDVPVGVSLPAGLKVSAVAAGSGFSMALLSGTEAVETWGTDDYGQLGSSTCCPSTNVPAAEVIPGDACSPTCGVLSIAAGEYDTELTITAGTVS